MTIDSTLLLILNLIAYPICSIMPRFIISVRELYDHDLRARWQGIDTGFGVLSQPIASDNAVVSEIAFADVTRGQGRDQAVEGDEDDEEAIQLEVLGNGIHQVVEGDHDEDDDSGAIRLEARGNRTCQV